MLQKLSLWCWRATATQTVIGVGLLIMFWRSFPPELPLFYSRPWGQDQLVSPYFLWILPLFGALLGIIIGVWGDKAHDKTLRAILLVSTLVAQLILTVGLTRIVLLIT